MAKRDLKYFMREQKEEIISMPGPESFVDDSGKRIQMEVKKLRKETITKIYDMYKTRKVALDKKGNPYVQQGEVIFETKKDNTKALRHVLCEAIVYPDLKDEELMKFYSCIDFTEMPIKVFSGSEEYNYVEEMVLRVLGVIESDEEENKSDIEESKN